MPHVTTTKAPVSVTIATQFIWLMLAMNALTMAVDYDDASSDAMVFNTILLVFNGFVAIKIAGGKNWARLAYSLLVAVDVALILVFGLDAASDLEVVVTYLSVALEGFTLIKLFGAEAEPWFKQKRND
jgi:hypothetical protein